MYAHLTYGIVNKQWIITTDLNSKKSLLKYLQMDQINVQSLTGLKSSPGFISTIQLRNVSMDDVLVGFSYKLDYKHCEGTKNESNL